jgi:serine/threonine protein kinase
VDPIRNDGAACEAEARVGETLLGKWHLDELLGVGGMAAVYSATHRNGLRGAVKMLHSASSYDETIRNRFLREGKLANAVGHPGAVRVLDDDVTSDGGAFLVMELLDGCSLDALAERAGGKLEAEPVLRFADQVLDVLASAHDHGIVHRDIKPEHVFVTREGHVKILDFGIACLSSSPRTTLTGIPIGTPAFMAPEQALGQLDIVGPQSDLWSLGATMFTVLSGQILFQERTGLAMMASLVNKPARSLADVCPGLPREVVEVVDGALRRSFAERWANARTMQAALRDAYGQMFGTSLVSAPTDEMVTPTSGVVERATPRLGPQPREGAGRT